MGSNSILRSEKGSIVLGALAVATLIAVFAGTIATQIKSADDMTQLPRIRATMAQVEVQTRLAAFSATSYACVYENPDDTTTYKCALRTELFDRITVKVNEGTVRVSNSAWNQTNNHFT
ncbi:MAG: hypothetical protein EOP06_27330, partial [Proteobacteria bacterium]